MTERQNRQLHITLLLAVIIVNLLVRFAGLFTEGFYGDESFSVFHAQQTIPELYERLLFDRNPPLYFFTLHFWIKLFGLNLFYLKGLSALFSVGTAAVIYLFAKRFLNLFSAVVASVFFLLSTIQLTMSHELRAFALIGLLCVMSFYFFLATLEKPKKLNLIILAIVNLLLMFTHYMSVFIPLVEFVCSFCFYKTNKKGFRYVVYSFFISALMYAPWIKIVIENIPDAGSFWLSTPGHHDLRMVFHNLSGTLILLLLHTSILLAFLFVLVIDKKRHFISEKFDRRYFFVLLLWYVLPVIASFFIAQFTPVFRLRYVVYSSLGLFLLLAYIISLINIQQTLKMIIVVLMLIIPITKFNPYQKEAELWRKIAPRVKKMKDSKSIVLISASYKYRAFAYYYNIDFFKDYKNTTNLLLADSVFLLDDTTGLKRINFEDFEKIIFIKSHQKVVDPMSTIDSYLMQHGFRFYDKFGENDLNVSLFIKSENTEDTEI